MKKSFLVVTLALCLFSCANKQSCQKECVSETRWSEQKAQQWYDKQGWLVGCNFTPSNAINQLEMWQEDTFDPQQIDKELKWAQDLGFTSMRVFLHSLAWKQDPEGFKKRIDQYLSISNQHGISTMFVLFDDCWNAEAKVGKQPEPKTGVHNSGWLQDPSVSLRKDTASLYPVLEKYVKDIIGTFKNDTRVVIWDLYNEPGNSGHGENSLELLKKTYQWARACNPSQPLTSGLWSLGLREISNFQAQNSDIITYHNYSDAGRHGEWIAWMKLYNRPLVCTEWMARRANSTFESVMPLLKKEKVGAYNWGFVSGKTNTIYAWGEPRPDGKEPELWFHDIIRTDGTPFNAKEIETIKSLTLK